MLSPRTRVAVMLTLVCGWTGVRTQSDEFTLTLLHMNDFHARFEETNVGSGRCPLPDAQANRCYGGIARIHTQVEDIRRSKPNVIFMAAGDHYQGTVWYTIHKWRPFAHFFNLIRQDVMSLGNHEFDDGIEGLTPFLENATFPVLAANIDASLEPNMKGKVLPSVVMTRGGRRIGIIGYVTTETEIISNPGRVKFLDEVETVRKESRRLRKEGVDIIIALGHAGYKKDLDIATKVEDVDIIVGGHTNTFLYTGNKPSTEDSVGDYPAVITQSSGRKVLVVQAYAFGKYLGYLQAIFDSKGEIIRWEGNPILLDNTVAQDPNMLRELIPWKLEVESRIREKVGRTFVFVDGQRDSCRMEECNMGNLITDSIIHQNAKYPDDMEWAHTSLAVYNGGGIRASFDEKATNGSITMDDILRVVPFQNTIDLVELRGRHVRQMFENSVASYDSAGLDVPGRFLQVSGFHVVYDISRAAGSRVVRLEARCVSCRIPKMTPINDTQVYKIAMPAFIANGGDGYSVVRDNKIQHHLTGLLDSDAFSQYIQLTSPIYPGVEKRILFEEGTDLCSASALRPPCPIPTTTTPSILTSRGTPTPIPVSVTLNQISNQRHGLPLPQLTPIQISAPLPHRIIQFPFDDEEEDIGDEFGIGEDGKPKHFEIPDHFRIVQHQQVPLSPLSAKSPFGDVTLTKTPVKAGRNNQGQLLSLKKPLITPEETFVPSKSTFSHGDPISTSVNPSFSLLTQLALQDGATNPDTGSPIFLSFLNRVFLTRGTG